MCVIQRSSMAEESLYKGDQKGEAMQWHIPGGTKAKTPGGNNPKFKLRQSHKQVFTT